MSFEIVIHTETAAAQCAARRNVSTFSSKWDAYATPGFRDHLEIRCRKTVRARSSRHQENFPDIVGSLQALISSDWDHMHEFA